MNYQEWYRQLLFDAHRKDLIVQVIRITQLPGSLFYQAFAMGVVPTVENVTRWIEGKESKAA